MKVKTLLLIIVLVLVAWTGTNYARGKALFSNPFAGKTLSQKMDEAARKAFGSHHP